MSALDVAALKKDIAEIVGPDRVTDDKGDLSAYSVTRDGGGAVLVARPVNPRQVRDLVGLANARGAGLVLSSSGPPRFRGDTAAEGEAVVVDMSGMSEIQRVDRRNKVALIEPGVTFAQLQAAANRCGLKALMPLLPRASKSVLASYLEREPITIPRFHWDMTDPLLCTELIFGTGDLFRTGSAAGPGNLQQQWDRGLAQKNPMGPAQTDFMRIVQGSQGTMAAVTWATIKLELKPSLHETCLIASDHIEPLIDFSYKAMRPKLADEFFILSSFALASMVGDGPEAIRELSSRLPAFVLVYAVAGFEYLPGERVSYQKNDLGAMARACGLKPAREVNGVSAKTVEDITSRPSSEPYFKLRPAGAFKDIFFLTTLDRVAGFIEMMESMASGHGYRAGELGVYVQPVQHGRACHLEFNLYYDPGDEASAARVESLFKEASSALCDAGAFFSRPYGEWSDLAYARCEDTVKALFRIKKMLDPQGVMNPGKLCFKEVR
jgi:FAD/FMN-containing dehydrogenase